MLIKTITKNHTPQILEKDRLFSKTQFIPYSHDHENDTHNHEEELDEKTKLYRKYLFQYYCSSLFANLFSYNFSGESDLFSLVGTNSYPSM